jgi:hypothetical protein
LLGHAEAEIADVAPPTLESLVTLVAGESS